MGEIIAGGVVLTGGTANLKGLSNVAEQVFGLPVRVGTPRGIGGLTDLVAGPEYGAAVGLVFQGASSQQSYKNVAAPTPFSKAFKRVGSWFSEHF